ncbi:MAG: radical SAM protein [Clostridia bacterium]|nr:radical SAM protein [Clostridia bacterium]
MSKIWVGETPKTAYIYPTIACNLKCKMCYSGGNISHEQSSLKEMDIGSYRIITEKLYNLGVRTFDVSGGEPFLRKDIFTLFEIIKSYSDTVLLVVSNGTLLRKNTIKNIDQLKLIDRLYISIDSPISQFHNEIRGDLNAFEDSMKGIETLMEHSYNSLGLNCVIMKDNYHLVEDIIDLAIHKRIKYLNLLRYIDVSNDKEAFSDQLGELHYEVIYKKILNKLKSIANAELEEVVLVLPGYCFNMYSKLKGKEEKSLSVKLIVQFDPIRGCPAFGDSIIVSSDGNVTGCTAMVNRPEFFIGNIIDEDVEVLLERRNQWRRSLRQREEILKRQGTCSSCDFWWACRGGCPVVSYKYNDDINKYDPTCSKSIRGNNVTGKTY